MPFKEGHKGYRTTESYKLASVKIANNLNSAKTRFKKGSSGFTGKHTDEAKKKMSKSWFKKGQPSWVKGKKFVQVSGERHWNWKGGITPLKKTIRESIEYKLWRDAVFSRDNWTCTICNKTGGNLNADHLKMFAYHPELRFAIDNGRTLCQGCHRSLLSSKTRKHICCQ